MPLCELKDICGGPWGIVAERRAEVEASGYGGFDRIVNEEVSKRFLSVDRVADTMAACISTARRWLAKSDSRYIEREGKRLYFADDVTSVVADRAASKIKSTKGAI